MPELLSQSVQCPYCGEFFEALLDDSQDDCEYIEDCYVCCRPIIFSCYPAENGAITVTTRREDE